MKPLTSRPAWIRRAAPAAPEAAATLPQLWPALFADLPDHADPSAAQAAQTIAAASAQTALDLANARAQAAEAEAERWRAHALATEADAQQRGFAAGYSEGERQGRQAGEVAARAALATDLARLAGLADGAVADLRAALLAQQAMLAALSVEIAQAVIGAAFQTDPELLAARVAALLGQIGETAAATVRLHPGDLPFLRAQWGALADAHGWHATRPHLVADDAVAPGGCIIEARTHYLDARPATLLALVRATFARQDAPDVAAPDAAAVADAAAPAAPDAAAVADAAAAVSAAPSDPNADPEAQP